MTRRGHHRHPLAGTGIRLHRWHYRATLIAFVGVLATGIVWSFLSDLLGREPDRWQRWLLQGHGAFAFLTLIAIGALLPQHVRFGWTAHRNRTSGTIIGAVALILVLTAYGLYYAGEDLRAWCKWIHLAIGIGAGVALPIHIWLGRRSRNSVRVKH